MRPRNPTMDGLVNIISTSPAFELENACKSVAEAVAKSKQPNAVTLAAMQEADDIINGVVPWAAVGDYDTWFANKVNSAITDETPSINDDQAKEQIKSVITNITEKHKK